MRRATSFQSEWGYFIRALRFLRKAVIVLAALALGATAGAGMVLSLIDRPVVNALSVPRALTRPIVDERARISPAQAARSKPEALTDDWPAKLPAANKRDDIITTSELMASPIVEAPPNIAARTELPAVAYAPPSRNADATKRAATAPVRKKANWSHRSSVRYPLSGEQHYGWY
jgi:hypothetical protein